VFPFVALQLLRNEEHFSLVFLQFVAQVLFCFVIVIVFRPLRFLKTIVQFFVVVLYFVSQKRILDFRGGG
jgi:hypothetical protein